MTERVARPFAGATVDRAAGTVTGVLICGTESANRRDYPPAVFRRDFAVYEGKPVNCDHGREATVDRRFGWFAGVHVGEDGRPRGTLHALKSHPMYERVMEAAERNPSLFGFSHVALCDTAKAAGGREVVEAIRSVESIDLVAEPATTKGLFEHKGAGVKTTLRAVVESVRAKLPADRQPALRKQLLLAEDDAAMGGLMDAPIDAPPDDAGPDDSIDAGIRGLVNAILDDDSLSTDDKLKKIRLTLTMGDKLNGSAPADDKPADDKPAEESRKPVDAAAVLAECKAAKFDPTYEQGEHLRNIPDAGTRAVVVESFKAAAKNRTGERVNVAGRHEANGAGGDKQVQESKAFAWQD